MSSLHKYFDSMQPKSAFLVQCAVMLSQDSFYRGLTEAEQANVAMYDFDSPNALDHGAIVRCLKDLKVKTATPWETHKGDSCWRETCT